MFKITGNEDSFLVCGDVCGNIGIELANSYGEKLQAKYVQYGHHGNNHVPPEEWAVVKAKIGFFDGPAWLNESDDYDTKGLIEWCHETNSTTSSVVIVILKKEEFVDYCHYFVLNSMTDCYLPILQFL